MRKRILIIMICIMTVILSGCGHHRHSNRKADDEISRAIYEAVGGKEIYYHGKDESETNVIYYAYLIHTEDHEKVEKVIETVNRMLEQKQIDGKISICFRWPFQENASEPLFGLSNFCDEDSKTPEYAKLQSLWITGAESGDETIYNIPSTYKTFQDIKYLEVSEKIQKAAEEEGVDWYEYWPELEGVEVLSTRD